MLSHLRFHRRAPSTPTSPVPENGTWDATTLPPQLVPENGLSYPDFEPRSATGPPQQGHGKHTQSPTQPQQQHPSPPTYSPPIIPPISQITSHKSESPSDPEDFNTSPREVVKSQSKESYNDGSGFLGGLALQKNRNGQDSKKLESSQRSDDASYKSVRTVTSPPIRPSAKPLGKTVSSFIAPTDLRNDTTGKRQPGTGVTTELQGLQSPSTPQEASRSKRGLPFLKNPMSTLLMRRKTSQVIPDLSLQLQKEPSYQPIRGTRIHDFSAPRPKRIVSSNEVVTIAAEKPLPEVLSPPIAGQVSPEQPAPPVPPKDERTPSVQSGHSISTTNSRPLSADAASSNRLQDSSSLDLSSNDSRREKSGNRRKSSIPASISSLSRKSTALSGKDLLSSLPRHMKSTSSRFSFDMIGAANQEKLLEDRHRQKQQDKAPGSVGHRDSRFDDFDEDGFDYDAMDFDDGLEERIPGVNADFDEDDLEVEMDPENDQENFAGFVFQRSNSASELQTLDGPPHPTPKDAEGNVLGTAESKDTPEVQEQYLSPDLPGPALPEKSPAREKQTKENPTGLGIQGFGETVQSPSRISFQNQPAEAPAPQVPDKDDELYFGGHEFEGEGDGSKFDESLFDLDDTDKYGRPIPGLFASAVAQRMASQDDSNKRDSDDVTSRSRLSVQSGVSQSTAHTSLLSLGACQKEINSPKEPVPPIPGFPATEEEKMAVYQAALAAAARKAEASGKFTRSSSPSPPADVTITSPTTSGSGESHSNADTIDEALDNGLDDYELDDGFSTGLDDYELDDDAIIAEANASALANDYDGWYGQEFGFYSAASQQQLHHGPNSLSEHNLFQYSNGGFFGPSGIARTKSGHLVSREPNLTPITERSEYSNRNSIMSLTLPANGNRDSLQSPGLAQLAMMADDDNMSLAALIRLRSKAWGGSQVSLVSSREGSPSERGNDAASPLAWNQDSRDHLNAGASHGRKNSAFSTYSHESGAGSESGSPTLTMSMPPVPGMSSNTAIPPPLNPTLANSHANQATSPIPPPLFSPPPLSSTSLSTPFPPVLEDVDLESDAADTATLSNSTMWTKPSASSATNPMIPAIEKGVPSQKRPGIGHRHKNSADSISYSKEDDAAEGRWVLERRIAAESGEISGRKVVESGRI